MEAAGQGNPRPEEDTSSSAGNRVLPSAESIRSVGGLVSVVTGVLAISILAIATMAFVDSDRDANTLIPLTTAAFGVISAVVGAYLGIKIGTDQNKVLVADATDAHSKLLALHEKLHDSRSPQGS
jgi:hypothetical protein